ncbi:SMI1/KNR4 family protein [Pseudoalteromonas sp. SG43-7]|uniref:SMI1/KNR4 family protein n=1 Tax=Pseudoalteromonas sp. SG43-7 TaxID=2760966 RepID=UPI001600CF67|nr:SMI1/KNR4 family protein [Pseudoalteromonas sp. SG43-7]MBB1423564.1 SMI1/KNR4 family protein [Pseudoalteromonas sp. SG43-7]
MQNICAYNDTLKTKKWHDFHFPAIEITNLPSFSQDESYIFSDLLHQAVKDRTDQDVLKLFLITPDTQLSNHFYMVAYLQDKTIFTAEVLNTPLFSQWLTTIDRERRKGVEPKSKLYDLASNSLSSRPISRAFAEQIFTHTGEFIDENIPNAFKAEELAQQKIDYITPFINFDSHEDFSLVKQNLTQLVESEGLKIIEPIDNKAIYQQFKTQAGFEFPTILKDFLTLHNGIEKTGFMNAQTILKEWSDWQTPYQKWTQEDLLDTYSSNDGTVLPLYCTPYWIPFFDQGCGNFYAIDLAPNSKGKPGQVISFGADQESGYLQAHSLAELIAGFMHNED